MRGDVNAWQSGCDFGIALPSTADRRRICHGPLNDSNVSSDNTTRRQVFPRELELIQFNTKLL